MTDLILKSLKKRVIIDMSILQKIEGALICL